MDFPFDEISNFTNGYAIVKIDGRWGVINTNGEFIVQPRYNDVFFLSKEDKTFVIEKDNGKFVVTDTKGHLSEEFDEIHTVSSTLFPVRIEEEWGAIDYLGNIIVPLGKFDCIYSFFKTDNNELFGVISDGVNLGLIDKDSNVIIPYEYGYEDIMWVDNNTIITKKDGLCGVIDRNNNIIVPFNYDFIDFLVDGFRFAQKGKKWTYIDERGNHLELKNYEPSNIRYISDRLNKVVG